MGLYEVAAEVLSHRDLRAEQRGAHVSRHRFPSVNGIGFGVEITLEDLEALPNKKTGPCKAHHVLGKIRLSRESGTELGKSCISSPR